jgi:glycosyltransferase involved in cell wall biosynthesis
MSRSHRVEVLTSCARDYITWKNERPAGLESVNGVRVRRFKVRNPRDPDRFGRISQRVFLGKHSDEDELRWLEEQGPFSPALLRYLWRRHTDFDYLIFFSYRYYHSYHGVRAFDRKAVLVPTAESDDVIRLRIFKDLFRRPRAIVYNSVEERDMIRAASGNRRVLGDVVGVGSDVPDTTEPALFRERHRVDVPYVIFIGRVDHNKGCRLLFNHFRRYVDDTGSPLKLVLVGGRQMEIPEDPRILYAGFLSDEEKWSALAGAELLVMPSELESLSMVTLEAWAIGKPVLANGRCDVLRGQCLRSNAGLFFDDYYEFRETLALLENERSLREGLGENGRRFYKAHYTWNVIETKYNRILDTLQRQDRQKPPHIPPVSLWTRWFGSRSRSSSRSLAQTSERSR